VKDQLDDLIDAVEAAPDDLPPLIGAVAADVADQIADVITVTLETHGCPRSSWDSHLMCGALAAVAEAMETGKDLVMAAVVDGVTVALTASGVPRLAARLTGRAASDALMKLTPFRHYEDVLHAVQDLAIALCPNIKKHPEVARYCLRPTESALLSSAIQEGLAVSVPWRP
jgi:hypothetical protein